MMLVRNLWDTLRQQTVGNPTMITVVAVVGDHGQQEEKLSTGSLTISSEL